ncbi:MAG: hypothetical protein WD049_00535 [Candidatus Paceibacterota bacterium]
MPTLHLILEARLSAVATKKTSVDCPYNLWSVCGSLPEGIALDVPHPVMLSQRTKTGRRPAAIWRCFANVLSASSSLAPQTVVGHTDHPMHDLSYEEFLQIRSYSDATLISENVTSGSSAVQAMLAVKQFARTIGYEVFLYETCDY